MSEMAIENVIDVLKHIRLKNFADHMKQDLEKLSPNERKNLLEMIHQWALSEKSERWSAQITSRIRSAKFNKIQTVDQFNFDYNKSTRAAQKNYMKLFHAMSSDQLPSAIFSGDAGLGKTHLARSLGYGACQKGLSVLFVATSEMVNALATAEKAFHLSAELKKYKRPQVLILDELGYVSMNTQASNLFFQVISARHDQGLGTIATTNLAFGKWNQIFANNAIVHAIVDRLVGDSEVFYFEGPSYRDYQKKARLQTQSKG
jgi:DNA replication protein DnaC